MGQLIYRYRTHGWRAGNLIQMHPEYPEPAVTTAQTEWAENQK